MSFSENNAEASAPPENQTSPWAALWTLVLGFFMILIDTTIVSVANPHIMLALGTTMTATLWATSAYLLAYAVPLLITGRLGDRFGPRRMYLTGLVTFTVASLACGLAPGIEALIMARVLQGLGASLMTPQTMAVITRIFPQNKRGQAMAIWGVTAGIATLGGPLLGGLLLAASTWEWIFFINVPIGFVAYILTMRFVPRLPTMAHKFDWLGVVLSALGMFLVVFGLQEGASFDWGVIIDSTPIPVTVWGIIFMGVLVLSLFILWQWIQQRKGIGEPLVPLTLFVDRNFSVGSAVILIVGFSLTSLNLPFMFYLQLVHGLTATQAALMLAPMAVCSILLARPAGRLIDRSDPRRIPVFGLLLNVLGVVLYFLLAPPHFNVLWMLLPGTLLGIGQAFLWGPLATLTTYNLQPVVAGAGSGVYNTSRQVGAVLGAAAMAVMMQTRLVANLGADVNSEQLLGGGVGQLPAALRDGFAAAMAESLLLPAAVLVVGTVISLMFKQRDAAIGADRRASTPAV